LGKVQTCYVVGERKERRNRGAGERISSLDHNPDERNQPHADPPLTYTLNEVDFFMQTLYTLESGVMSNIHMIASM
jgi:hypothetical protein